MLNSLENVLKANQKNFQNIAPFDLNGENVISLDLSKKNKKLLEVDFNDEQSFCYFIDSTLESHRAIAAIGGYAENRALYSRSDVFIGTETRSIHLGIDIWAKSGTAVFAPLDGTVHSFSINNASGDYGPTIILKHALEGFTFYSLYGHLSTTSLDGLQENMSIKGGQQIATLGEYHENVHWPPHLHFQLIKDIGSKVGDYPGVAAASERDVFLTNCPDPNLILQVDKL